MNRTFARRLMLGLSAAAALGAAGGYVAFAGVGDREDIVDAVAAPTPAMARALGVRWRAERTDALAAAYANALLSAGLHDRLLTELSEYGLFEGDGAAIALYRAEAAIRQGRFDAALDAARAGGEGASSALDPYLAFARARAAYALTGAARDADADLALALRGPQPLSAQAYLFRARLALDANDVAAAEAAARRAREAGADRRAADDIQVEAAIRSGDLETAAKALNDRTKAARRLLSRDRTAAPPAGDDRLAAMLALKAGDARAAVRLVDQAASIADDTRTPLLAALAKYLNGDLAQAYALTTAWLATSPQDWIAQDLAAALARDLGRIADADALLLRLEKTRPDLAAFRRYANDPDADAAFEALLASTASSLSAGGGAAAALLGAEFTAVAPLAEPTAEFVAASQLATALGDHDDLALRSTARAASAASLPITLALAGEAYARLGERERAADLFERAAAADPAFLAPVSRRTLLLAQDGRQAEALVLWRDFAARNPGNDRARLSRAMLEADLGASGAAVRSFATVAPRIVFSDRGAALSFARSAVREGGAARAAMVAAAEAAAGPLLLGEVFEIAGEDSQAAAQFRKALIVDPSSDAAPALYVITMLRLDRGDEAASLLREIVRRRPEAKAAAAALKMAENNSLTASL